MEKEGRRRKGKEEVGENEREREKGKGKDPTKFEDKLITLSSSTTFIQHVCYT